MKTIILLITYLVAELHLRRGSRRSHSAEETGPHKIRGWVWFQMPREKRSSGKVKKSPPSKPRPRS